MINSPSRICLMAAILGAVLLAGCQSPHRGGARGDGPPPKPQPTIRAEQTFLEGTITLTAVLSPFRRPRPGSTGGENDGPAAADQEEFRGPRGGGGGRPEGPPPGGERPDQGGPGMRMRAAGGPARQSLAISLTNTSDTPIRLRVAEVKSILGSFEPVPDTFTLEPGASQALEPMRGSFAGIVEELDLTIRLRTVEANETQELRLK